MKWNHIFKRLGSILYPWRKSLQSKPYRKKRAKWEKLLNFSVFGQHWRVKVVLVLTVTRSSLRSGTKEGFLFYSMSQIPQSLGAEASTPVVGAHTSAFLPSSSGTSHLLQGSSFLPNFSHGIRRMCLTRGLII